MWGEGGGERVYCNFCFGLLLWSSDHMMAFTSIVSYKSVKVDCLLNV